MIFYLILGFVVVGLVGAMLATYKIHKAHQEIDRLFKQKRATATGKSSSANPSQNIFEVRKKNEENTRSSRRDDVINRLQQSGDLRD